MLSVQVMQPPVCGHKMLLSVYHASHKMHITLIHQSHHIWCVSHHIVTLLAPLTCCSPSLWGTVMTLTFNLPNTANCQSNLELKVGINIQILKLHKPNIASIKIKTVYEFAYELLSRSRSSPISISKFLFRLSTEGPGVTLYSNWSSSYFITFSFWL